LLALREAVLTDVTTSPRVLPSSSIVGLGPWYFPGDAPVVIVCAELPKDLQEKLPFTEEANPDFTALSRLTDLDALFELRGHIRAVNPDLQVVYRSVESV